MAICHLLNAWILWTYAYTRGAMSQKVFASTVYVSKNEVETWMVDRALVEWRTRQQYTVYLCLPGFKKRQITERGRRAQVLADVDLSVFLRGFNN
ncbi:hypothetical protein BCR37DRAFT_378100 [Protomyces lactucae-debilis]|uniref:Uncharacterized protein n=1 Tax=Protomyces lactucae-debilis TaxID=2754530 RepID=A0A1Y2FM62_PROLT|nr:uncharacterized protein BCR37DRAFT_378100 [Protomyces lactucae-debilis]ORY85063.1 hypothetical protein BCR37DRAFT_378100 [Protomyces lactucae-debilis]